MLGLGLGTNKLIGKSIPFDPSKIDGLQLWLDATDLTTITKDGSDFVSAWNDKSDNSYSFTQGTASAQPKYFASGFGTNNKPRLNFSGTHWLSEISSNVIDLTTDFTIFAVHKGNTTTGVIFSTAITTSGILWRHLGSTSMRTYIRNVSDFTLSGGQLYTDTMLFNWQLDRANNTAYRSINNVDYGNTTISTVTAHQSNLILGAISGGSSSYIGDIVEILYYNTFLSNKDLTSVKNYLNNKYGIY